MKPRLESAPYTREDRGIWLRLNFPLGKPTAKIKVSPHYIACDRRDADLMLRGQNYRALGHACVVFDLDDSGMRIYLGGEKFVERGAERLS